jgi:type I restriction enzyme, R subunit
LTELIQEKTPKATLTELFLELKTDKTPALVERIVTDIDIIVRVVSFPGWQKTVSGEREVLKSLGKPY